jgi:hypothetical protein
VSSTELKVAPWIPRDASSEGDDPIPDLRFLLDFIDRQQPRIAAVDQWVPEIAVIEIDRSVDGGNSHAISVIANA